MRRAVEGSLDVGARLARREAAYPVRVGIPVPPPRVGVVPGASATATVLEVRAHDRPGLLHCIASALFRAGADIRSARVSTLGSEAVDVFYVLDSGGQPLPDASARTVAAAVQAALSS